MKERDLTVTQEAVGPDSVTAPGYSKCVLEQRSCRVVDPCAIATSVLVGCGRRIDDELGLGCAHPGNTEGADLSLLFPKNLKKHFPSNVLVAFRFDAGDRKARDGSWRMENLKVAFVDDKAPL